MPYLSRKKLQKSLVYVRKILWKLGQEKQIALDVVNVFHCTNRCALQVIEFDFVTYYQKNI